MVKVRRVQSLRIIGGQFRGRKLRYTEQQLLRPSKDSTREMLFNWLTPYVYNAACVDLFAGSGAFGIEALSRGAHTVHFVENNKTTAHELQQNLAVLVAPNEQKRAYVHILDAHKWLARHQEAINTKWNIVFCDPPFAWQEEQYIALFNTLSQHPSMHTNTLVYLESSAPLEPCAWRTIKHKSIGAVHSTLLEKI